MPKITELRNLIVKEISLVDNPAIDREFLFIKNAEGGTIDDDFESKRVIPYKHYALADKKAPWDAGAEVKKAEIVDLKVMCTLVDDSMDTESNKGAYKLPHHKAIQGQYPVVFKAVSAAIGALNGARANITNMSPAEKQRAYTHLVKHYKEFPEVGEPPELKEFNDFTDKMKKWFSNFVELFVGEEYKIIEKKILKEDEEMDEKAKAEFKEQILGEVKSQIEEAVKPLTESIEASKTAILEAQTKSGEEFQTKIAADIATITDQLTEIKTASEDFGERIDSLEQAKPAKKSIDGQDEDPDNKGKEKKSLYKNVIYSGLNLTKGGKE